jgi:alginate O-acetyltransferase complex protein AlgI
MSRPGPAVEFPTLEFVYFGLLTLTLSWLLRQTRTVQKGFLLAASYYFAWKWQPIFFATLVASSLFNFGAGKLLLRHQGSKLAKPILTLALIANLGLLGFFKYYGFFVDNLGVLLSLLGLEAHLPLFEIIAPFGISFYTFQSMAYLVDTHRKKAVQPKSLLDFLLFLAFFPKFGAGPICRSGDLLPQLAEPAPKHIPELSTAVALITTGLLKKMVMATYVATHLTTDAFLAPSSFSSAELVLAVFAYTAQVYLDFSGYTDLARGIALLFGFRLPENFRYPYAATDIGDFWRRWHITFSTWLREYIYFPLGGSRDGRLRCYLNLMITFTACGIWHGPTWGYIVWGALHGVGLSVYKASLDIRRDLGIDTDAPQPFWWLALGWLATLSFCAFVRIFFVSSDFGVAMEYWRGLFAFTTEGRGFDLGVLFVTVVTLLSNFFGRRVFDRFVAWHDHLPALARPLAWAGILLFILTIRPFGMAATIYFGF